MGISPPNQGGEAGTAILEYSMRSESRTEPVMI